MKNLIPLVVLCLLFFQCNVEDNSASGNIDDEPDLDITNSIVLDVRDYYFDSNGDDIAYLSDQNGIIIVTEELSNFNQTILTADFDTTTYDLTIFSKPFFTSGGSLRTFLNVKPAIYTFQKNPNYVPNVNTFNLNISETTTDLFVYAMTGGSSVTSFEYTNDNGGTLTVGGVLEISPADYFLIGKLPQEPFPRYFWKENISPNDVVNVVYNELPYASSIARTQFPDGDNMKISIIGRNFGDVSQIRHYLQESIGSIDGTLNEVYYPPNIFDYFETSSSYWLNDTRYFNQTINQEIRQNLSPVSFNLEIENTSITDFRMTTTGNYDFFETTQTYFNPSEDIYVTHFIVGEQSQAVSYTLEKVFNKIFSDVPSINAGQLKHEYTGLYNLNFTDTYSDVLKYRIAGDLDLPIYYEVDGVSKLE